MQCWNRSSETSFVILRVTKDRNVLPRDVVWPPSLEDSAAKPVCINKKAQIMKPRVELVFSHGTSHTLISSYFHNAVNPHPAFCLFILYLLSHFSHTVFLIRTYVGIKLFHSLMTYLQTDVSFSVTRLNKYLNFLCNPLISLWWWLTTTRLYILLPNIL